MDPRGADRGGQVTVQPDWRNRAGELPEPVAEALALAEIPPSKLGPARRARLTDSERELYFWILRHFRTTGRPSGAQLREAAERLGIDAEEGLETLAREDLVHRGPDGEITVAYPFSGRPTAHRVHYPGGQDVDAMCAIDALGIAPIFGEQIEVASRDPVSGDEIRARVAPDGAAEWWPRSAVVVAGALDRQSDSCCGCYPVLNFFVSPRERGALALRASARAGQRDLDARRGRSRTSRVRRGARPELMPRSIDRQQVQRLLAEQDAQLVEALPAAEYEDEHLPRATNVPLKEVDRQTATRLDNGRPVIVYCYDFSVRHEPASRVAA
jgi:hypothetical protein